ncbi:uncharacterized, partial [Tachysurus ichikawai]
MKLADRAHVLCVAYTGTPVGAVMTGIMVRFGKFLLHFKKMMG